MGANLRVKGKVIRGHGEGKKLGFPTANIEPTSPLSLPFGVYACRVRIEDKKYNGVLHWGPRIVFGETKPQCEVYLLNFSKNIYRKTIEVEIAGFIRPSQKFSTLGHMVNEIKRDCVKAKQILD